MSIRPTNQSRPSGRARGFTLLEVLIVVGILAILASIITIAISSVMASSKGRATRVALENCMALQTEYENATKLPGSLKATYSVSSGGHVIATIIAMEKLRQIPKNKDMLDRMSAGSLKPVDTTLVALWNAVPNYGIGEIVQNPAGSGTLYRANSQPNNAKTPGTDPEWSVVALPVNTLADAWGNPIYCAGSALRLDQTYNASQTYRTGMVVNDGTLAYKCVQNAAGIALSNASYWLQVSSTPSFSRTGKDNRIFWVSGGPDGDLLTDDDNLYSFEN